MSSTDPEIEIEGDQHTIKQIRRQLRQESAYVHLLRVVTSASNESTAIEEPLQATLDAICALTGWPIGHALLKIEDREELVSAHLWHLEQGERFAAFREVTEALAFGPGIGLPGRVLSSGAPVWILDVSKDSNFPRNRMIEDLGLAAAFAFPILVGREVTGVLEFFNTEMSEPDETLLTVMNQVGALLGRIVERRRAEQALSHLAQAVIPKKGEDLFESIVTHLAKSVRADYALVGKLREGRDEIRTLAVSAQGQIVPNFEYALPGTPCENVMALNFCSHASGVREKFPNDKLLVDMQVDSYVGTPLFDSSGRVMGLLAALWRQSPANLRVAESMVQIFAVRAAAELELQRAEDTAQKLAEVPRANPHPVLEFSGDGVLRFTNRAAYTLARSVGKDDPIHILPKDTAGIVKKCLMTGTNGVVVDKLADNRTIIWSFIPIVKNDSVFAHAFELTLFLDLHEEMRRMGAVTPTPRSRKTTRHRSSKESVH